MKTTKKYLSLVCCAICAIATCLALVACGGGKAAKGAKMVGYWELVSGKADGTEADRGRHPDDERLGHEGSPLPR